MTVSVVVDWVSDQRTMTIYEDAILIVIYSYSEFIEQ